MSLMLIIFDVRGTCNYKLRQVQTNKANECDKKRLAQKI